MQHIVQHITAACRPLARSSSPALLLPHGPACGWGWRRRHNSRPPPAPHLPKPPPFRREPKVERGPGAASVPWSEISRPVVSAQESYGRRRDPGAHSLCERALCLLWSPLPPALTHRRNEGGIRVDGPACGAVEASGVRPAPGWQQPGRPHRVLFAGGAAARLISTRRRALSRCSPALCTARTSRSLEVSWACRQGGADRRATVSD